MPEAQDARDGLAESAGCCPLTETMAAALVVHNLIIEGLHEGTLSCANPAAALQGAVLDVFGLDFAHWAEFQFEVVYGTDPYTFLTHILAHARES